MTADRQERVKLERGSPEWIAAWKCCGCGMVHGEDLAAACDCPTACLGRGGHGYQEIVVKVYPPEPARVASAAAAIMDVFMGGDQAWRARMDQSEILDSADWARAVELATAVLSPR